MGSNKLGGLALAVLLICAACSSDAPAPDASGGTAEKAEAPEPPPVCIDGARAEGAKIDRPAVALKIENSSEARPQSGLEEADLVYEEIVEGGMTRFMAL